jgi:hypothetical protein
LSLARGGIAIIASCRRASTEGKKLIRHRLSAGSSLAPWLDLGRIAAFTFRALSKTYGQMWLRCDVCRRYVRLKLAGLHDVDYQTKAFSCSVCGSEAYFCLIEPTKEFGMHDYRLDEVEKPARHPAPHDLRDGDAFVLFVPVGGGEAHGLAQGVFDFDQETTDAGIWIGQVSHLLASTRS